MSVTTATLEQICEINPRLSPDVDQGQPVSFVPMSHVNADTAIAAASEERTLRDTRKGFTPFQKKDIIVAKITPCFENGKIAQVDIAHNIGFGSTEFHVVRPDPQQVNARFLLHYLRRESIRRSGEVKMIGSGGQRRVPESFIRKIAIPVPDLVEQQRIAALLDQTLALRARRREALIQLDDLTKSVFFDMFGNPATNPHHLPVRKISDLNVVSTGTTPPRSTPKNFIGTVPWVKTTEVNGRAIHDTEEHVDENLVLQKKIRLHPPGSIVVALYGQGKTRGQVASLGVPATTNQACAVIYPSSAINSKFLEAQLHLSYDRLRSLGRGGNQANLNVGMISNLAIIAPPYERQHEYAKRNEIIEQMKQQHRAHLAQLDELFASLQDRAFSGRL